jgi:F-type H+-transporting ATPase subunit b
MSNNPLVQLDPGLLIWSIVTFLALVALLAKFAWRPLLEALERRRAEIASALDNAERARAELQRVHQDAAKLLAEARVEAGTIVSRTRADAERLREELRQKALADAAAVTKNAEQQIQLETARAIRQIRDEAANLSIAVASKLLRREVSQKDNETLIQDAIKQFEGTR